MRILFITAFYPPYVIGGWEQLVQDINMLLQARGHVTRVLTSSYGAGVTPLQQADVKRTLHLEGDLIHYRPLDFFMKQRQKIEANLSAVQEAVQAFQPDVIFIHGMWNLSRCVAWQAEQLLPGRVVYYMANDWPHAPGVHRIFWQDPARSLARRITKKLLAPYALRRIEEEEKGFPLRFERVLCVSQAVQRELVCEAGIPEENLRVVYNGVELDRFRFEPRSHKGDGELSLLYAGSLVPHKGVHTAVEAMQTLQSRQGYRKVSLTIVGSGHPGYEAGLKRRVAEGGLGESVFFWPRVSREEMPSLLRKFDVLVFPSTWEEPLARMMQEAMASGLVVLGTPTGGTPEILHHEETGLIFRPGDAQDLASQVERLGRDPELRERCARNARRLVEEKFDIVRMIDEIEVCLMNH
jgi:glycosyltransferase involved in cell wall biosynthesis